MTRLATLTRRFALALGGGAAAAVSFAAAAHAEPVELRYFYRAPWPSSEIYANWMIDEWNKKNGDRIHVTGASVDGETYKTKQTIELSPVNPPDVFYSWEGGRAKEIIDNGFAADLTGYYAKYGWDETLNPASVSLATFNGKKYFVPTEIGASVVWYRKDLYEKLGLTVPKTWDELMANAAKAKAAGIAPFMLANQKKWPSQFMWSAIMVNKYGLDTYRGAYRQQDPLDRQARRRCHRHDEGDWPMTACSRTASTRSTSARPWSRGRKGRCSLVSGLLQPRRASAAMAQMLHRADGLFPAAAPIGKEKAVMSVFAEDTLMIHARAPIRTRRRNSSIGWCRPKRCRRNW